VSSAPEPPVAERLFEDHRALLFTVAYEMLGSVADADDVVQESWLRWAGVDHDTVRDPRAYLVRVVTRGCPSRCSPRRTSPTTSSSPSPCRWRCWSSSTR
jgi:RNA polymerase sigma-70 factor (ECF subfamily)